MMDRYRVPGALWQGDGRDSFDDRTRGYTAVMQVRPGARTRPHGRDDDEPETPRRDRWLGRPQAHERSFAWTKMQAL
jgi:hypothetical protein